jgi:hypothetical protein
MDLQTRDTTNTDRQQDAREGIKLLDAAYAARMAAAIHHDLQKYLTPGVTVPPVPASREVFDYEIVDNHPNCINVFSTNGDALELLAAYADLVEHGARVYRWSIYTTVLVFMR